MPSLVISFEISIVAPNILTGGIVGNHISFEALMGAKETYQRDLSKRLAKETSDLSRSRLEPI